MVRFVILHHVTPPGYHHASHWDVMWESGGALRTWAVFGEPAVGEVLDAVPLPDHRSEYLSYEGPISDNRGSVSRFDTGACQVMAESDGRVVVRLMGQRVRAEAIFRRETANDVSNWRVEFSPLE